MTLVFPEEKESISRDTEITIGSILENYNQRGQQFLAEGIEYSPITLLTTISNLYLIKKYKSYTEAASITGLNDASIRWAIKHSKPHGGYNWKLDV